MGYPRALPLLLLAGSILTGCGAWQALTSGGNSPLSPAAAPGPVGEVRWVLIQNLRYGATMAEPEYVWVREDRVPSSATTFIFGKQHVLAPADVVQRYAAPPEGGQISPLQGGPPLASRSEVPPGSSLPTAPPKSAPSPAPAGSSLREAAARGARAPETVPRGYIVHVQAPLIVVDLTAADGIQEGSLLSLRREHVALKHPVTGEYLGELDEEIGTARIIELRERFSVAEIQGTRPGFEPRIRDRAVVKPP